MASTEVAVGYFHIDFSANWSRPVRVHWIISVLLSRSCFMLITV